MAEPLPASATGRSLRLSPRVRIGSALAWAAFVAVFVGATAFFTVYDLYHRQFNHSGAVVALYNALRLVMAAGVFLIVATTGWLLLRRFASDTYNSLDAPSRLMLAWFAGVGPWHLLMFAAGYANLYIPAFAWIVTAPFIVMAWPFLKSLRDKRTAEAAPPRGGLLRFAFPGAALIAFGVLTAVKGLYPAGGHDFYSHYQYFYGDVISSHGLWPNAVWYHYFYSKGAGLFFLGILLADPMAPQLVSLGYVFAGAGALWLACRRLAPVSAWPWVAVILYCVLYTYSPGEGEHLQHGGWGDFEKLHEMTQALVLGVVWATAEAIAAKGRDARPWLFAAASTTISAVLIQTVLAIVLGALYAAIIAWFALPALLKRDAMARGAIVKAFWLGLTAATTMAAILAINYATTGLMIDQSLTFTWRFADMDKLYQWGALFPAINVHWALTGLYANSVPVDGAFVQLLWRCLRLPHLWPMLALAVGALALAIVSRRALAERLRPSWPMLRMVLLMVAVFAVVSLVIGRSQAISYFRFASFGMGLALMLLVGLIGLAPVRDGRVSGVVRAIALPALALAACLVVTIKVWPQQGQAPHILAQSLRFATGKLSLDAAFVEQEGWPGRMPWGGIYPGARGAYETVGPDVPIISMHVHAYCMLPGCRVETAPAFITTRDMDRVMYADPAEAKAVLHAANHDYVLFSKELSLENPLRLARLFDPDIIGQYMGVAWTDGVSVLLTWKSDKTQPFEGEMLEAYRAAACKCTWPLTEMKTIWEQLRSGPHPWRQPDLPWATH